jgi:YVTN family beta-propeller protein
MWKPLRAIMTMLTGLALLSSAALPARSEEGPLQLDAKIPLGDVRGRIDHMAVDWKRQRLFVAELGNDTVAVVDLANQKLIRTIPGLNEPQGVGYEPSTDMLFIANARDGSVRLLDGSKYKTAGQIALGSDADNVRIDAAANRVFVGFGDGGLAALDPSIRAKVQRMPLKAHPESFQIVQDRIFVNLPDKHAIAVVDSASGKQLATWPMTKDGNFAMTIDRDRGRILVGFRNPAELGVFAIADGHSIANVETCGDVDDLFFDAKRSRVYVSCGAGYVDVFEVDGTTYRRSARIPTAAGARTSLFVPELDLLLVAVRAGPAGPTAIWMFKPLP